MNKALIFVNHKMRTPLTAQQVNYWKLNLSRILKIGAEFEFNLPEKNTGTCKGRSYTCPCTYYGKDEFTCWTKCVNEVECKNNPDPFYCANAKPECIDSSKCITCKDFNFKCIGITCVNNVPTCTTCEEFKIDCNTCEYQFDPTKNPDSIRRSCTAKFNPSGSYGIVSKSGVHNVVTDGSLLGKQGMEVITTGRRVDYWEFYRMSKDIIDTSVSKGAYINERCSIHMHGLASYYGKIPGTGFSNGKNNQINEMERSVPEIILANLHQLIRRYQNAITWMSSALDDPKHLTRWEKFRVSILDISAIPINMKEVREQVVTVSGGNKYGWINYKFCKFDHKGDINRLHVEIRVMDGILSPSVCAAFACLYYALFIKAVELSRYGVIESGSKEWHTQAKNVKNALLNNTSDYTLAKKCGRFSDTTNLHKYTDILIAESFEMISQLKHILSSIGPAYEVLEKIAESPCSIRRCEGQSWEEIENAVKVELTEEGVFEYEIKKIIDTREVIGVEDVKSWMIEVSRILHKNKDLQLTNESEEEVIDKLERHIEEKQANGEMIWANKIGTMITV